MTVIGGGGGVGATTVVAELARALAALGRRVAAVDTDLGVGDLDARLGIDPSPSLAEVIAGSCSFADALQAANGGVRAVAAGRRPETARALSADERVRLIEEFDASGTAIDVILFDAGSGVSPNTLFFAGAAQRVVLITTPVTEARHKTVATLSALAAKLPKISVHVLINCARATSDGRRSFGALASSSEPTLCADLHYLGELPFADRAGEQPEAEIPHEPSRAPEFRQAVGAVASELFRSPSTPRFVGGGLCLFSQ